jgi:hypothetical protein
VQGKIDTLTQSFHREMQRLERELGAKKLPILQERNRLLAQIPGFWARALQHHPNFGHWSYGGDIDRLQYLVSIDVEDAGLSAGLNNHNHSPAVEGGEGGSPKEDRLAFGEEAHAEAQGSSHEEQQRQQQYHEAHRFRIVFSFKPNPYFADNKLWRVIDPLLPDLSKVECSGVSWLPSQEPNGPSFFQIFENPTKALHKGRVDAASSSSQDQQQDEHAAASFDAASGGSSSSPFIDPYKALDVGHMVRHEIWANPFAYYDLPSHAELMAEEARYEQERIRLYEMSAAQGASAQGGDGSGDHHADFYLSQQERERKQHEEVEAAMVAEAEEAARQAEEQARLWERETLANL